MAESVERSIAVLGLRRINSGGLIPLDGFRVSSRWRTVRRRMFSAVTVNTAFKAVIDGCAAPSPGRDGHLDHRPHSRPLQPALHAIGHLPTSVEAWRATICRGLYASASASASAFGESMFQITPPRLLESSTGALVRS